MLLKLITADVTISYDHVRFLRNKVLTGNFTNCLFFIACRIVPPVHNYARLRLVDPVFVLKQLNLYSAGEKQKNNNNEATKNLKNERTKARKIKKKKKEN